MIGNEIEFKDYDFSRYDSKKEPEVLTGIVVDAFTKVTGHTKGSAESFLGFGSGSVSGNVDSNRMYKVEYSSSWDTRKKHRYYKDIHAWQLIRIVKFANAPQEVNEEKIIK